MDSRTASSFLISSLSSHRGRWGRCRPGEGRPRRLAPEMRPQSPAVIPRLVFAGVPISLVINSTGLQAPGHLESVELSHSSGRSLLTLPTQLLSNGSTHQLWAGPPFHVPKERFYLKVKGKDQEGNPLLRVSGVSYSGVAPGECLSGSVSWLD